MQSESTPLPILWSFRRCPYAIRARLGLHQANMLVELREIVLRDKPDAFVATSPSKTVPCLKLADGTVLDESLDILLHALKQNDPAGWLTPETGTLDEMLDLIHRLDGDFKGHLDAWKYAPKPTRKEPDVDCTTADRHRDAGLALLGEIEERLAAQTHLFGNRPTLADIAIAPFVRQFANTDRVWWDAQNVPRLQAWLNRFADSGDFEAVMEKYAPWEPGTEGVRFPA